MAHDVFVSYASSDKKVADAVCSQLETIHKIRCWIAPRDVTPGASWAESIIDALDGSKVMVLIFSSNANASMQIEREVERAVHKGIHIIPLRIEDTIPTKTLEYFISAPHWLDAMSFPVEQHINKLATSVKSLLSKYGPPPPPQPPPAEPAAGTVAALIATPAAAAVVQEVRQRPEPPPATAPPPPAPPMAAAASEPRKGNAWVVPVAIVAVLLAAAAGFGVFWNRQQAAARDASKMEESPAATSTPAPETPAATPQAAPSAAEVPAAPAPAAPAAAEGAATAAASTPAPAKPAAAAAVKNPNVFIEFRSNVPDGELAIDVDGQRKWSQKFAEIKGLELDDIRGELNLPKGERKVDVTLLFADGKVRDTQTTKVLADPDVPRTLRIRLSRFRHNLELQTVVGKPAPVTVSKPSPTEKVPDPKPTAAAAAKKPVDSAKANAAK